MVMGTGLWGKLIALGACLALAGCVFPPEMRSRAIEIPRNERSIDSALAGDYWQMEEGGSTSDFRTVNIRLNRDRTYRFAYYSKSDRNDDSSTDELGGTVVVLKTGQPGVDVLLFTEKDATVYMLALRSRAGSWVYFPFLGDMDTRIGKGRLEYLAQVASRHGLTLLTDPEADERSPAIILEGKLNSASIAALFSDVDFLGALRLDPGDSATLLPANRPLPPASDGLAWWPYAFATRLGSDRFDIPASALVQPDGLVGAFMDAAHELTASVEADGSLLLAYPPAPEGEYQRQNKRLRFIDIGEEGRLLVLSEESESTGQDSPPKPIFRYYLASASADGSWSFEPVQLVAHDFSRTLDGAAQEIRSRAAARQGLALSDGFLSGPLDIGKLKALMADPQFQAGLDDVGVAVWFDLVPVAKPEK